jgi:putative transposase
VSRRVSPTERIRAGHRRVVGGEGDLGQTPERVACLGARLFLQAALEAEVTEFLGRNRYECRLGAKEARAGSRKRAMAS